MTPASEEPPGSSERLAELVAEHLMWLAARGYADSTVRARKREVERLTRWLADRGVTRPTEVTLPVLERYRVYLYRRRKPDGTPLTWGSQTQKLLAIRGLFRWLALTRRIRSNPAADLELPRKRHRIPKAVLSARETELVLEGPDVTHPLGVRDRAILETLYSTGVRRAELAALDLTDVDLTRLVVLVRSGKGGHDRLVPLGERAARWIDRYLDDVRPLLEVAAEPDVLFLTRRSRRITPRRLSDLARRYVDKAGLGKILGHRELSITALYTHLSMWRTSAPPSSIRHATGRPPTDPPGADRALRCRPRGARFLPSRRGPSRLPERTPSQAPPTRPSSGRPPAAGHAGRPPGASLHNDGYVQAKPKRGRDEGAGA